MSFPKKGFPYILEDCEEVPLKNKSDWSIQGFSKGGERTSFRVKPLNILFDVGVMSVTPPKAILLTHSHVDHTWNLPNLMGGTKANTRTEVAPCYFPRQAYNGLTKLLEAASILSHPKESFTEEQFWSRHLLEPHPVSVGETFNVGRVKVEVLQALHVVHSVGYGLSTEKSKLKEEYAHLAGNQNEIIFLKKSGVEVVEKVEQPELAFYCDSTIENLLNYSEWKKYPSVVVECTGFSEIYDKAEIQRRGHTHIEDLLEVIKEHVDKNWFLIHSTMKSDVPFLEKVQKELSNLPVTLLSKY